MTAGAYEALLDLIEIFEDTTIGNQEIDCFNLMKRIVDGKISKESLDNDKKLQAQRQLDAAKTWLQSLNIKLEYKEELFSFFE